ncbi:mismatch-specific DNA-glycosylase [Kitasatospora cineracea]|uniref:Mismatch-specific thymine-DNA glycosylase n=1 Tax=Kitasatospora cineracea TaxID=88074 RepID=A0A3N4S392_9ACTN|nr:mismatch-specific DNA-glycosylase [Kitasatospora cineracea]RPE33390.1 mismatch-specific thymine-DNA glycosylase [Kitasatospora cineracea]
MTDRPPPEHCTRADLDAARTARLPDLVRPGLRVLFCGINPGLRSAASGLHSNRPGNRFRPALHRSGFTPRLLTAAEQDELLTLGLGISNLVDRPTAGVRELSDDERRSGARLLTAKVEELRPARVAPLGVTGHRAAFTAPRAHGSRTGSEPRLPRPPMTRPDARFDALPPLFCSEDGIRPGPHERPGRPTPSGKP